MVRCSSLGCTEVIVVHRPDLYEIQYKGSCAFILLRAYCPNIYFVLWAHCPNIYILCYEGKKGIYNTWQWFSAVHWAALKWLWCIVLICMRSNTRDPVLHLDSHPEASTCSPGNTSHSKGLLSPSIVHNRYTLNNLALEPN